MEGDVCGVCGGDGRIANAFGGSTTTCPGCHGTGRRTDTSGGFHDVTKTKPSHHRGPNQARVVEKQKWPSTPEGALLATEVQNSTTPADTKARLILEIIEYETTHARCTQTFVKKVRKQFRPHTP